MYRHYRGPDYYSFNAGGIHFVGLNSVDIDDTRYYGHVDSLQLAWLARDLAAVPASTPVVTFNHIPFFTAVETINGYNDAPPAPSVITVNGRPPSATPSPTRATSSRASPRIRIRSPSPVTCTSANSCATPASPRASIRGRRSLEPAAVH
jgi:3',5'-cyclic AMP phosphodiesterase CpdA